MQVLNSTDSAYKVVATKIPVLYQVATMDSKTGTLFLKVVNTSSSAQNVAINLTGISKIASNGLSIVLKADDPKQTNSITDPEKLVPVTKKIKGVKKKFEYVFPAYSITVLQLETSK